MCRASSNVADPLSPLIPSATLQLKQTEGVSVKGQPAFDRGAGTCPTMAVLALPVYQSGHAGVKYARDQFTETGS